MELALMASLYNTNEKNRGSKKDTVSATPQIECEYPSSST